MNKVYIALLLSLCLCISAAQGNSGKDKDDKKDKNDKNNNQGNGNKNNAQVSVYPWAWVNTSVKGGSDKCNVHDVHEELTLNVESVEYLMFRQEDGQDPEFAVKTQNNLASGFTFEWSLQSVSKPMHPKSVFQPCWVNEKFENLWNEFYYEFGSEYTKNWASWDWSAQSKYDLWFETDWASINAQYNVDWAGLKDPAFLDWWKLLKLFLELPAWSNNWDFTVDADWNAFVEVAKAASLVGFDFDNYVDFRLEWVRLLAYYKSLNIDLTTIDLDAPNLSFNLDFTGFDYLSASAQAEVDFSQYEDFSQFEQGTYDKQLWESKAWWLKKAAQIKQTNSKKFVNKTFKNVNANQKSLVIPARNLKPRYEYTFVVTVTETLEDDSTRTYRGLQTVTVGNVIPLQDLDEYVDTLEHTWVGPRVNYDKPIWVFYNFEDVSFPNLGEIEKVRVKLLLDLEPEDYNTEGDDSSDSGDSDDDEASEKEEEEEESGSGSGSGSGNSKGPNKAALAQYQLKTSLRYKAGFVKESTPDSDNKGAVKFDNPGLQDDKLLTVVIEVEFDSGVVLTGYNWAYLIGSYYADWGTDCANLDESSSLAEYLFCDFKELVALRDWVAYLQGSAQYKASNQQEPECNAAFCSNKGTCEVKEHKHKDKQEYQCTCQSGYFGKRCELDSEAVEEEKNKVKDRLKLIKDKTPQNAKERKSIQQLIVLQAQNDAVDTSLNGEIVVILKGQFSLAESADEVGLLIQGLDGVSKKASKQQKKEVKAMVKSASLQFAKVLDTLDEAEQVTDTLIVKAKKVNRGQSLKLALSSGAINSNNYAPPEINIPSSVLGNNIESVAVSITSGDVFDLVTAGAIVSVDCVDSDGNEVEVKDQQEASEVQVPIDDNAQELECQYLVEGSVELSTDGVTTGEIDVELGIAECLTKHFTSFTVTAKTVNSGTNDDSFNAEQTNSGYLLGVGAATVLFLMQ